MKTVIGIFTLVMVGFCSCKKESTASSSTTDCGTVTATYSADASAIFVSYCATNSSCHGSGSNKGPGALTTYQLIYNNRYSIRSAVASGAMPEGTSLSAALRSKLLCWIDTGALNN